MKIHSSCEIEYFVDTHLCKLCVILRSRVLRVVCPHYPKDIGRRLPLQLHSSYVAQLMLDCHAALQLNRSLTAACCAMCQVLPGADGYSYVGY